MSNNTISILKESDFKTTGIHSEEDYYINVMAFRMKSWMEDVYQDWGGIQSVSPESMKDFSNRNDYEDGLESFAHEFNVDVDFLRPLFDKALDIAYRNLVNELNGVEESMIKECVEKRLRRLVKEDSWDDALLVPKGYAPGPYGSSEEVWNRSVKNLVDVTVKTIVDYYNPKAYNTPEALNELLKPNGPIWKRMRGDDPFYTFTSDRFYNTFEHWCEYYGKEKGIDSYSKLRANDKFLSGILSRVKKVMLNKYCQINKGGEQ